METLEMRLLGSLGVLRWVGVHIWAGRARAEHKGRTRAGELGVPETRTLHRFGGKQAVEKARESSSESARMKHSAGDRRRGDRACWPAFRNGCSGAHCCLPPRQGPRFGEMEARVRLCGCVTTAGDVGASSGIARQGIERRNDGMMERGKG